MHVFSTNISAGTYSAFGLLALGRSLTSLKEGVRSDSQVF